VKGHQISWVFGAIYPKCGWGCQPNHGFALTILPSKEPSPATRLEGDTKVHKGSCGSQVADSEDFFQLNKAEVESSSLNLFCTMVNVHHLFKLEQHCHGFHPVNAPLVSVEYQLGLYVEINKIFPTHYTVFDSLVFSDGCLKTGKSEGNKLVSKKVAAFTFFLALCRQKHFLNY
jgi:hypothetical protein